MGSYFVAVITIQLDGIPPQQVPAATGITNFLRITATAFSTSLATTTWDNRALLHQSRLAEATGLHDATASGSLAALQALGVPSDQSIGVLTHALVEQSYLLSSLDIFWVSAWASLALVPIVWLARRPRVAHGVTAAAE
jgi:DHA2 family multidrug resistance protein